MSAKLLQLCLTPGTVALQAPLSMGFSREGYCSGLPCPPPGDPADPGIGPKSFMSPALAGVFFTTRTTWEAHVRLTQLLDDNNKGFGRWVILEQSALSSTIFLKLL